MTVSLGIIMVAGILTIFPLTGLGVWRFQRGETPPAFFNFAVALYLGRNLIARAYSSIYGPINTDPVYWFVTLDAVYLLVTVLVGIATANLFRYYLLLRADPLAKRAREIIQDSSKQEFRRSVREVNPWFPMLYRFRRYLRQHGFPWFR